MKDEVILENGKEVEHVILVKKGRLRLRKILSFTQQNIIPAPHESVWDANKAINEEELTVAFVGPGKLIGLQEIRQNQPFNYGTLIVDEDDTALCYIDRINFMRQVDDRDLD